MPSCPQINSMRSMYTVEYYLAMKRNDILAHVTTGVNLEAIMLSDRGQSQRATESVSPFL